MVEKMCDAGGKVLFSKVSVMKYDRNGNQTRQTVEYTKPKEDGATAAAPTFKGQVFGETANIAFEGMVENTMNYYDGFNRLKKTESIKTGLRTIVEFSYDGDDLRVSKAVKKSSGNYAEEVTNYLYDRQHVILETDGTGNIKARYIKGINYIARIDGSNKLSYMLYNGHGDVVQTVSQTGNVENRYDYDIFGMPTLTMESYSCSIRYAGEYYDAETGLYYLRARYYNPQIGRFISEDSYWGEDSNPLSLNLYTYCHNDPIQFVDPSGHSLAGIIGGVIGGLIGGSSGAVIGAATGEAINAIADHTSGGGSSGHHDDDNDRDGSGNDHDSVVKVIVYPDKMIVVSELYTEDKSKINTTYYVINTTGNKEDDLKKLQEYFKKSGYENTETIKIEAKNVTTTPANVVRNYFTIGDKGDEIAVLQLKLKQENCYQGPIDGIYGQATKAAVLKYQIQYNEKHKYDISEDGLAGKQVFRSLGFDIGNSWKPSIPMRKYADYLKYATEHEGYKVKGPWNENYVKPKPAKSDDATVIMVFKSLVDALPPPSGQGTGNGPVIRTMTQREQEKWQSSEIIPYVPIVSTANNASIALTGYDLNGFYKNEGEVKAAKENMVVDVALIYMGGSAAKNGLKAVDDVANGVKQGVSSEAVDLSKSTFRDMSNGRFVKNPVKEMQTRLDNAIESVQYGNDKAIYEKQLAEYNEVLKGSKEAKDLNDALYHAYDIAHSKGWDKIAFDYLKNLFTKK